MIGKPQSDVHARSERAVNGYQRRHHAPSEPKRRRYPQHAAPRSPDVGHAGFRPLDGLLHLEAAFIENPARLSELHPPGRTIEQAAAKVTLKHLHSMANHRRR